MDFGVQDYLSIGVLVGQGLMTWISWSMRRAFVTKSEMTALQQAHDALSSRLDGVQRDLKHMPTKDDLHALQLELTEAVGEIKLARAEYANMMALMERVEDAVTRHEQIFVDAARKR